VVVVTRLWRSGRGLWAVALVAAAVVPAFLHIATLHREYWAGSLGADFWQEAVRPWTARVWAVLGVLILAGFASTAGVASGPVALRRVASGALGGGLGLAVWLVASLPGLVWLARLGVEGIPNTFAIAGLALVVAALVAGMIGAFAEGAPAAAGGAVVGTGVLMLCWGQIT
jgi:hypothetical protein